MCPRSWWPPRQSTCQNHGQVQGLEGVGTRAPLTRGFGRIPQCRPLRGHALVLDHDFGKVIYKCGDTVSLAVRAAVKNSQSMASSIGYALARSRFAACFFCSSVIIFASAPILYILVFAQVGKVSLQLCEAGSSGQCCLFGALFHAVDELELLLDRVTRLLRIFGIGLVVAVLLPFRGMPAIILSLLFRCTSLDFLQHLHVSSIWSWNVTVGNSKGRL